MIKNIKNIFLQRHIFNKNINEILLNLVKKYEIKKILYSKSQFSKFKYEYIQKYILNKNINERFNEIKLYGKNLLICNMNYIDFKTNMNQMMLKFYQ